MHFFVYLVKLKFFKIVFLCPRIKIIEKYYFWFCLFVYVHGSTIKKNKTFERKIRLSKLSNIFWPLRHLISKEYFFKMASYFCLTNNNKMIAKQVFKVENRVTSFSIIIPQVLNVFFSILISKKWQTDSLKQKDSQLNSNCLKTPLC